MLASLNITATKLIALRVLLGLGAVAIFPISQGTAYLTLIIFLVIDVIDLFDGLVSEHQGEPKPFGGFLDISADQCIEMMFWFLFLQHGLVTLWIPTIILIRNALINLLRMRALSEGQDMFGSSGMLKSPFARRWVGQRAARGVMVVAKTIGFAALIFAYIGRTYHSTPLSLDASALYIIGNVFLWILVVIHVFRGTIICWEARAYFAGFGWSRHPPSVPPDTGGSRVR
jgi:phosphatidylglycerophosphate synthase